MHKQCSQIGVTALAQLQLPNSTTCACLSRNQSHPSGKLPTGAKGFGIAQRGNCGCGSELGAQVGELRFERFDERCGRVGKWGCGEGRERGRGRWTGGPLRGCEAGRGRDDGLAVAGEEARAVKLVVRAGRARARRVAVAGAARERAHDAPGVLLLAPADRQREHARRVP